MFNKIKINNVWSIFIRLDLIFSISILLLPSVLWANYRTLDEVRYHSKTLIQSHIKTHGNWGGGHEAFIQGIEELTENNRIVGYFVTVNPQGYIVVVADPVKFPVRCYSEYLPIVKTGLKNMSQKEKQGCQLKIFVTHLLSKAPQSPASLKKWQSPEPLKMETTSFFSIGPLTNSVWHQGYPFNGLCPIINDERVPAGCLPIAMAQLMYYWQHPFRIQRGHSYLWSNSILSTDNASPYEWHKMQDDYGWWWYGTPDEAEPVARLLKHNGVALESEYSQIGTSANVSEALYSLRTFFDYSEDVELITRGYMTADDLMETIFRPDIEKNQPLLYGIYEGPFESGHGAVVDGYESISAGKFIHLNFGWGDVMGTNSWYHPDEINLGEGYDYSYTLDQTIIRNIKPMVHQQVNKELKTIYNGVLDLSTEDFAAAAVDNKNIAIVFEMNYGSWQHTVLDPTNGTFSAPETVPSNNWEVPKLVKTKQGQYAIGYSGVDPVFYDQRIYIQLKNVTGIPADLTFDFETNTNEFSMCGFKDNLLIAGMDMEWVEISENNFTFVYKPFLYRYNLLNGSRSKNHLSSANFEAFPDLVAIASSSKFAVLLYQVDEIFYRYIISPEFTVSGPLQINTGISGLVSNVSCIAIDDIFMLAWSSIGDTHKIKAETFSKTADASMKQLTLEASFGNQISGMLAAFSSNEIVMATLDDQGCGIQIYSSELARLGHPVWEEIPGSTIPKVSISKVNNSRSAALWLTQGELGSPEKLAYSIVQGPISNLPFLMLLTEDN